jgi:hypothetical protein
MRNGAGMGDIGAGIREVAGIREGAGIREVNRVGLD